MKIVDRRKFVRSLMVMGILIILIGFVFINKSFSHSEISYKKIYVSSGDTLWNIAKLEKNHNVYFQNKDIRDVVEELKSTNNLTNSNLEIGQELNIPII